MELTWHGWSCFRLKGKEASIVIDPSSLPPATLPKLTPDIVILTQRGQDSPAGPFRVINGPGEYEVKSVLITAGPTFDAGKRVGAFYKIEMDDLVLCHLGQLKEPLTTSQVEALGPDIDVLFVPIAGGDQTIDAARAVDLINLIEPRMIVPMHFELTALGTAGTPVEKFCHEIGKTAVTPQAKLAITRTTLPAEPAVVVLEPR